ncbi:MAG: YegS/Rv2252/BmrU family lipid kinase [Gemmatimonadota bacterium]|nr:YegS/Rv2252/BmrU family lipid kinase [Gemmatimonadota bacterium]
MRVRVILNPTAGGGVRAGRVRELVDAMSRASRGVRADLRVSARPGDVHRLAAEASRDGVDRVVAAGGDGTVAELANGLLAAGHRGDAAILPVGTGNDLARALGLPADLAAAAALAVRGRSVPVDAMDLHPGPGGLPSAPNRAWNSVVGGFAGRIGDRLPPSRRRRWGSLSYLRAALDELRELRPHRVRLQLDGEPLAIDLLMLVVANGRYAGGRLPLAPAAHPGDGRLDVVVVPALPRMRLLALVPAILAGRHLEAPGIVCRRVRRVRIEAGQGFWMNADGETWVEGSGDVEARPAALRFVQPGPGPGTRRAARRVAGNPAGPVSCPSA